MITALRATRALRKTLVAGVVLMAVGCTGSITNDTLGPNDQTQADLDNAQVASSVVPGQDSPPQVDAQPGVPAAGEQAPADGDSAPADGDQVPADGQLADTTVGSTAATDGQQQATIQSTSNQGNTNQTQGNQGQNTNQGNQNGGNGTTSNNAPVLPVKKTDNIQPAAPSGGANSGNSQGQSTGQTQPPAVKQPPATTQPLAATTQPSAAVEGAICLPGTWNADAGQALTEAQRQARALNIADVSVVVNNAAMRGTINTNGTATFDMAANITATISGVPVAGTALTSLKGNWTVSGGTFSLNPTSYAMTINVLGQTYNPSITNVVGNTMSGSYTCNGDTSAMSVSSNVLNLPANWTRQ